MIEGFGVCTQEQFDELVEEEGTLVPMSEDAIAAAISGISEEVETLREMVQQILEESKNRSSNKMV